MSEDVNPTTTSIDARPSLTLLSVRVLPLSRLNTLHDETCTGGRINGEDNDGKARGEGPTGGNEIKGVDFGNTLSSIDSTSFCSQVGGRHRKTIFKVKDIFITCVSTKFVL
jgi:hypothetical protein